jgi:hypothetical protein
LVAGKKGIEQRVWRIEQGDLKPEYLSTDFCSLSSGIWLRVACCVLRVIGYWILVDAGSSKQKAHGSIGEVLGAFKSEIKYFRIPNL